jgi:lactate dehydrogenase-like 2-hydroxyacid dehydrogenase
MGSAQTCEAKALESSGWAISEERSLASVSPWHIGDRLEPEPDRGQGQCRRRAIFDKQTLFREEDVVTIHLVLSSRTRGVIGAPEFGLMKPSARFVNTSRGPTVDEAALIEALQVCSIAVAAVDVFDVEPPPGNILFGSSTTCSQRRTLATLRMISIAPFMVMLRPISPHGSRLMRAPR